MIASIKRYGSRAAVLILPGLIFPVLLMPVLLRAADSGAPREIDVQKSVMTVRVFKAGLFSAFGHEHEISAPIRQGSVNEGARSVDLIVDERQMRVMDKDVSSNDRAEIRETMLGPKVLDSGQFPEIHFHSTAVEPVGEGHWRISGDLSLHGQTHPVKLEIQGQDGHYRGSAELKQRDFGIEPIVVGGGTVKVKNELRVEFDIVAKP
jgi:polyisoprenoid-binding protein YceI